MTAQGPEAEIDWVEVPFQVSGDYSGSRLDAYLALRLRRYSRAAVQRLIDSGRVFLRGKVSKSSARVAKDDRIVVRYPRLEDPPPRYPSLPIIYEDDDLLAINKPGDILSHPTDKVVRNSVVSILRAQTGRRLHLVHRLDRETSGVLLLAKRPAVARALTEAFTRREIQKIYIAIVFGGIRFDSKIVNAPIGPEGLEIKVRQAVSTGQPAITHFKRLAVGKTQSVVLAAPKTGRLHQIRAHLAWLGHPVVGDKLYVGNGDVYLRACRHQLTASDIETLGASRQMLHAARLEIKHPVSGKDLTLDAPLPADFLDCLQQLIPDTSHSRLLRSISAGSKDSPPSGRKA